MPKKDWEEIIEKIGKENLIKFKNSDSIFFPNKNQKNIFNPDSNDFSSKDLEKEKPANWIPLYKKDDICDFLRDNKIMPIRSGKGSFFFYKGDIFFNLDDIKSTNKDLSKIKTNKTIPLTLSVPFHKNENAYLNKSLALGILNDFLGYKDHLAYGQSGKIHINENIKFYTSKSNRDINKGFQFEVDLVLESDNEIIIFEAKNPNKTFTKTFSLLQLYYPYIYIDKITESRKKIRTIFIDILKKENREYYKLVEIEFKDKYFDQVQYKDSIIYS